MNKPKNRIVLSISRDEDKVVKVDQAALNRLNEAVKDNLSISNTLVKRVKGETEKTAVDLPKVMLTLMKRVKKEG